MSIEVESLVSGYGDSIILHGVSIAARRSEITCILGANGAGKTTLLNTIYGLLKVKSGKIVLDGKDITGLKPHKLLKKGVAYVLQRRSVFPYLEVTENLKLGGYTLKKEKMERRMKEVYDLFPILKERKNVKAGNLSGGEQRMLEIARAMMVEPKILILDEPTLGLAPKIVELLFKKIEEANKIEQATILLAEQNVRKALAVSHHAYVLDLGRVNVEGRSDMLLQDKDLAKYILGVHK
jgi:ABC-type branched-subunit amino acid transport system ATPase component